MNGILVCCTQLYQLVQPTCWWTMQGRDFLVHVTEIQIPKLSKNYSLVTISVNQFLEWTTTSPPQFQICIRWHDLRYPHWSKEKQYYTMDESTSHRPLWNCGGGKKVVKEYREEAKLRREQMIEAKKRREALQRRAEKERNELSQLHLITSPEELTSWRWQNQYQCTQEKG